MSSLRCETMVPLRGDLSEPDKIWVCNTLPTAHQFHQAYQSPNVHYVPNDNWSKRQRLNEKQAAQVGNCQCPICPQ